MLELLEKNGRLENYYMNEKECFHFSQFCIRDGFQSFVAEGLIDDHSEHKGRSTVLITSGFLDAFSHKCHCL